MTVKIPKAQTEEEKDTPLATSGNDTTVLDSVPHSTLPETPQKLESQPSDSNVSYSNNLLVTLLAFAIWLVIVAANVYVIVTLGKGGET